MKYKKILKQVAIVFGFIIIIASNVLSQELSNLDEIWVYNFGRCILEGLVPYRDFNIIITPLFSYICAVLLKIFGNEMIVLRFAEIVEISVILMLIYKILIRLKINNTLALLVTLGIYYMYHDIFCFDYNWAVLLIILLVLFIELKDTKERLDYNLKKDFFLGILVRNNDSF